MESPTQTFEASIERGTRGIMLAFQGELDISTVQRAETELERAEAALSGGDAVVLDLRRLDFMDSTGLRFILGAQQRAGAAGRRLAVVQGPEAVERVFRVTRVDAMLEIVSDPADVLGPAG